MALFLALMSSARERFATHCAADRNGVQTRCSRVGRHWTRAAGASFDLCGRHGAVGAGAGMAWSLALVVAAGQLFGAGVLAGEVAARFLVERAASAELLLGNGTAVAALLDDHAAGSAVGRMAHLRAAVNGAVEHLVASGRAGARHCAFATAQCVGRGAAEASLGKPERHAGRTQTWMAQQHALVGARLRLFGIGVAQQAAANLPARVRNHVGVEGRVLVFAAEAARPGHLG